MSAATQPGPSLLSGQRAPAEKAAGGAGVPQGTHRAGPAPGLQLSSGTASCVASSAYPLVWLSSGTMETPLLSIWGCQEA